MGKCVPGMPCYGKEKNLIIYTTYPKGCTTEQFGPWTLPLSSDQVYYSGPNLVNIDVETNEFLTTILQKIDNFYIQNSRLRKTIAVNTATINLNFEDAEYVQFLSETPISGNRTITFSNDSQLFEFVWRFSLTGTHTLTFPNNVEMSDVLWNDVTKEWSAIDIGNYELTGTYDGTTWYIRIYGIFN